LSYFNILIVLNGGSYGLGWLPGYEAAPYDYWGLLMF
jgi:hypothetical protein